MADHCHHIAAPYANVSGYLTVYGDIRALIDYTSALFTALARAQPDETQIAHLGEDLCKELHRRVNALLEGWIQSNLGRKETGEWYERTGELAIETLYR
jgi:hypothetical protein